MKKWLVQPVLAKNVAEKGGTKEKRCKLTGNFIFVSTRHCSAGLVAGRTTHGVGGLCIFVVTVLRDGSLPTDVGGDVAT